MRRPLRGLALGTAFATATPALATRRTAFGGTLVPATARFATRCTTLGGALVATTAAFATRGAAFGLIAYATYDLTNLATLKGWPLGLAAADVAWGTFASAVAATAGRWVAPHVG